MSLEDEKMAQEEYCEENGVPLFAPYNGICHRCYKSIYQTHSKKDKSVKGYTVEEARHTHITSCPQCNASFLE